MDPVQESPGRRLLAALAEHRLLAVIRGPRAALSVSAARTLIDSGVRLLEVSLTSDQALGVIESIATELARSGDDVRLGAGTVLTAEQARQARDAGASFVVTPALTPALEAAVSMQLPVLAGAATPSELLEAVNRGADAVKLFPATQLGGPRYLVAVREPFPHVAIVPVGGVELPSVAGYLAAGAVAVGVGSPLLGDAVRGGDLAALRERAAEFLAATRREALR